MPAKSQAQRAYLNAKFGHAWVKKHHFDQTGKLPAKAGPVTKALAKKETMMGLTDDQIEEKFHLITTYSGWDLQTEDEKAAAEKAADQAQADLEKAQAKEEADAAKEAAKAEVTAPA